MPFINTKLSVELNSNKEKQLKDAFGKAITALGKSEGWLMLNFEDNCRLWFKGENDRPIAIAEISLYGSATRSQYDNMTAQITEAISQIAGIDSDRVYVKYSEFETWGFGGNNL